MSSNGPTGTILLVYADDGDIVKENIKSINKSITILEVKVTDIHKVGPLPGHSIIVLIVTPKFIYALEQIDIQTEVPKTERGSHVLKQAKVYGLDCLRLWLNQKDRTMVVHTDEKQLNPFDQFISNTLSIQGWEEVRRFNVTDKRQRRYANAEMTHLLEETKKQIEMCNSDKFIFKPTTLSRLISAEIMIVLSDANEAEEVTIKSDQYRWIANKIQTGIWSFIPTDIPPGKHILQVFLDGEELGSALMTILEDTDVAIQALSTAMGHTPLKMLSKLLNLDEATIDTQLAELIECRTELILSILGLGKTAIYPDLETFCTKYDLTKSTEALRRKQVSNSSESDDNSDGEILPSPFMRKGGHRAPTSKWTSGSIDQLSDDSGRGSSKNQSADSVTTSLTSMEDIRRMYPNELVTGYTQKPPAPLPIHCRFNFGVMNDRYDTIDDLDECNDDLDGRPVENHYDEDWHTRTPFRYRHNTAPQQYVHRPESSCLHPVRRSTPVSSNDRFPFGFSSAPEFSQYPPSALHLHHSNQDRSFMQRSPLEMKNPIRSPQRLPLDQLDHQHHRQQSPQHHHQQQQQQQLRRNSSVNEREAMVPERQPRDRLPSTNLDDNNSDSTYM